MLRTLCKVKFPELPRKVFVVRSGKIREDEDQGTGKSRTGSIAIKVLGRVGSIEIKVLGEVGRIEIKVPKRVGRIEIKVLGRVGNKV